MRKVELGSGVVTGLLGVIVALYMLSQDYEAAKRLSEEYPFFKALAVALIFFIVPGLLIAIGSYLHAVLQRSLWGRGMIVLGSLPIILVSLSIFITPGYQDISFAWLRLLLMVMAFISLILSFVVQGKLQGHDAA
jgi:hypothetical protein